MKAVVTGVMGQDGSYLADLLVAKGYEVHGVTRRYSSPNLSNIQHLLEKDAIHLVEGDLTDSRSLFNILEKVKPDEVYNLGAMSHVGTSFSQPDTTFQSTGIGALRVYEAVRQACPRARVYQASSSEQFGSSQPRDGAAFDERDIMSPCSPYGVAKLAAHHLANVYRTSYGLHISAGVLFNHECFVPETPLIIKRGNLLDCLPIHELMPNYAHKRQQELDFEVWDKKGWTKALLGTANLASHNNHFGTVQSVRVRSGEAKTTLGHKWLLEGSEIACEDILVGDTVETCDLPEPPAKTTITMEWAELLGLLVAEGSTSYHDGSNVTVFRNNDPKLLQRVQDLWEACSAGSVGENPGVSGFTGKPTRGLRLQGAKGGIHHWLYDTMYTEQHWKRVPIVVLNSSAEAWRAFLHGYNLGDGLKAGNGAHEFKNFKTSSPTLAAGLWWMASKALRQKLALNIDSATHGGERFEYYSINLGVPNGSAKGRHLLKPGNEVKSLYRQAYTGYVFDIATASKTLHAGVGNLVLHNSERRGTNFVTRKITRALARMKYGLQPSLQLGNLDAVRDWGYAPEYVDAMWRMLQQDTPNDYVVATGHGATVREFLSVALRSAGMDDSFRDRITITETQKRPFDVEWLVGNAAKAREAIGWRANTLMPEIARRMATHDLALAEAEA